MSKSKKERREKFLRNVKQTEEKEVREPEKQLEEPSKIVERILMRELKGKIGKKDIDEEER